MSSANAPDAERVLTLYRLSSWAGGAARIEVELNGVKTELGAFSTLELKPKEGINEFKKTAMISTFGARVENAPNFFKPETFSFTYRKGELLKIGVAALEPTVLYRLDKDGNYLSDKKVVEIKTIHDVYAKPENVSVKVVYPEGKWEKNLYDNSKAVPKNEQVKVGIVLELIEGTSKLFHIVVRWEDLDEELTYPINVVAGQNTKMEVSPPKMSSKYLELQLGLLQEKDKPDFICKNGMHPVQKKYDECIAFLSEEAIKLAQQEKLKQEQIEFNEKLASKEGVFCTSKLRRTHTKDEFTTCHAAEVLKSIAAKKFTDAVATNEGEQCKRKFRIDGSEFWKCFEKTVAEVKQKQKELEEKEFEERRKKTELAKLLQRDDIARQCVEIGFEIGTSTYKDCYLKLKLHTEQIAEWRRLQTALQNQSNALSSNQPSYGVQNNSANNLDEAARLLEIAQRGFNAASRLPNVAPMMQPPPPPMQIITPRGNSYNCSMMGAALRCR